MPEMKRLYAFLRWRTRHREVGFSILLGLLATSMFVVSPLARSGLISAEVTEGLRFGLAATAILIVNRNRYIGIFVAFTFALSLLCTVVLRTESGSYATYLANIVFAVAFELGVVIAVAHSAFDRGHITVHRIMGAVLLYLYIGRYLPVSTGWRSSLSTLRLKGCCPPGHQFWRIALLPA